MEAELKDSDPFRKAAILVEYGSVQIGDGEFICPVRSLALSDAAANTQDITEDVPTRWLNETCSPVITASPRRHGYSPTLRIRSEP